MVSYFLFRKGHYFADLYLTYENPSRMEVKRARLMSARRLNQPYVRGMRLLLTSRELVQYRILCPAHAAISCTIDLVTDFFARDYSGGAFEFLGSAHLSAIALLIALNLYLFRYRYAGDAQKGFVRWALALILWGNELAWHYWNYSVDLWTIQSMLPLHLCSLLVWAGGLMLVTKRYSIYEFMYLAGIGGAIQALATPDLGIYGFPHFRFFQTFISHGLIITSAIYMTVVEQFRPTWKSLLRVAIWMNIYVVIVYFINTAIGSNYLMINYKPATRSLLDLLPEWPIYILYMEGIGVLSFLLLYLPFAIKDWNAKRDLNRDNASRLESISK